MSDKCWTSTKCNRCKHVDTDSYAGAYPARCDKYYDLLEYDRADDYFRLDKCIQDETEQEKYTRALNEDAAINDHNDRRRGLK